MAFNGCKLSELFKYNFLVLKDTKIYGNFPHIEPNVRMFDI